MNDPNYTHVISTLHCRGCDCEECMPGYPAEATPVHQTDAPLWERALEKMRRGSKRGRRAQRLRREQLIPLRVA